MASWAEELLTPGTAIKMVPVANAALIALMVVMLASAVAWPNIAIHLYAMTGLALGLFGALEACFHGFGITHVADHAVGGAAFGLDLRDRGGATRRCCQWAPHENLWHPQGAGGAETEEDGMHHK